MTRNSHYWQNRVARQMYAHQKDADAMLADLVRYYIAASHYMQSEAEKVLKKFQNKHHLSRKEAEKLLQSVKDPGDIKAIIAALKKDPKNAGLAAELESQAYAARIGRLAALHAQLQPVVAAIAVAEGTKGWNALREIARDAYYHKIFDLQKYSGSAFPFKLISEKNIRNVLDRSWAGSGFSARVWGNTQKLEEAVKREIAIGVMTGRPTRQTALAIDDEFRKGYNAAKRLIRTETTYVTNQMHRQAYDAAEVEKYIYVATLDLRTSKVCRSLDGKTFKVKEAEVGINYPPMHPNCRSVTIAWLPDKWLAKMKRRAWNPKTGRTMLVPANMTYKQWYDKYVLGKGGQKEYVDNTADWSPAQLSETDCSNATEYVRDGKTYYPDGRLVKFEYDQHEKDIGDMISEIKGVHVDMLPKVNYPQGVPSADYYVDSKDFYDLKTLSRKASDNTIFNRVKAALDQADRFIIDVTKTSLDDHTIESQIDKIFTHGETGSVKEIVIVKNRGVVKSAIKK